jgi:hypothetical protein
MPCTRRIQEAGCCLLDCDMVLASRRPDTVLGVERCATGQPVQWCICSSAVSADPMCCAALPKSFLPSSSDKAPEPPLAHRRWACHHQWQAGLQAPRPCSQHRPVIRLSDKKVGPGDTRCGRLQRAAFEERRGGTSCIGSQCSASAFASIVHTREAGCSTGGVVAQQAWVVVLCVSISGLHTYLHTDRGRSRFT